MNVERLMQNTITVVMLDWEYSRARLMVTSLSHLVVTPPFCPLRETPILFFGKKAPLNPNLYIPL